MLTIILVSALFMILLAYFLGIETGRDLGARTIEADPWFASADPAGARYAAELARGDVSHG